MTIPRAERSAARSLAAVSGAPYQSCLLAVRVLGPLADRVNLGDLAPIVKDVRGPRLIGLRADATDLSQLGGVFEQCAPAESDAFAAEGPYNETRLLVPIASGGRRLFYDIALDGHLWPGGVWRFSAASVPEAVRSAQNEDQDAPTLGHRILVCAKPADPTVLPPDPPGNWSIPELTVLAEPTERRPGPGFDWAHFSLVDLGLGTGAVVTGEKGSAADLPYGITGEGPSLPEPLLACCRELVPAEAWHAFSVSDNPQIYLPPPTSFPEGWWGVDLPASARLWFSVPRTS